MSRYRNALAGQREAIRALWGAVAVALVCALILGVGWMTAPSALRIHIPPDLTAGATVRPDAPGPPHVYTFALYIWQQLYRWPSDGATEYRAKLDALVHFLTPCVPPGPPRRLRRAQPPGASSPGASARCGSSRGGATPRSGCTTRGRGAGWCRSI